MPKLPSFKIYQTDMLILVALFLPFSTLALTGISFWILALLYIISSLLILSILRIRLWGPLEKWNKILSQKKYQDIENTEPFLIDEITESIYENIRIIVNERNTISKTSRTRRLQNKDIDLQYKSILNCFEEMIQTQSEISAIYTAMYYIKLVLNFGPLGYAKVLVQENSKNYESKIKTLNFVENGNLIIDIKSKDSNDSDILLFKALQKEENIFENQDNLFYIKFSMRGAQSSLLQIYLDTKTPEEKSSFLKSVLHVLQVTLQQRYSSWLSMHNEIELQKARLEQLGHIAVRLGDRVATPLSVLLYLAEDLDDYKNEKPEESQLFEGMVSKMNNNIDIIRNELRNLDRYKRFAPKNALEEFTLEDNIAQGLKELSGNSVLEKNS